MLRLVKVSSGGHELEMFRKDINYMVIDNVIFDERGKGHELVGTEQFLYSTGTTFYVYTKDEVQSLYDALQEEIDGISTGSQDLRLANLQAVIEDM